MGSFVGGNADNDVSSYTPPFPKPVFLLSVDTAIPDCKLKRDATKQKWHKEAESI